MVAESVSYAAMFREAAAPDVFTRRDGVSHPRLRMHAVSAARAGVIQTREHLETDLFASRSSSAAV